MAAPTPGAPPGARILLVSDDDDLSGPLAPLLRRAGYRVETLGGREGLEELRGSPPDVLILDHDLPREIYQRALARLEAFKGAASFPLLILGGGPGPALPPGWHEDAALPLARPPQPGEALAGIAALRRLAFYRLYRDLVHDLSQPVTTIHALVTALAKAAPGEEAAAASLRLLKREADRLMSLMEDFQRMRASRL
jgi:CheY-like chemotaxis protein